MRRFLHRFIVCTFLLAAAWAGGFVWYVAQIPAEPVQNDAHTDAIVVLTGGSGRIIYGLKLLNEDKAEKLFITGMESPTTPGKLVERYDPALASRLAAKNDAVVMLGYDARNTIGNALETASWMRREKLKSLRLVTANYHMPRALSEFRFAMPEAVIVAEPVITEYFKREQWWTLDPSSKLALNEYHKYMAALIRHWLIAITGDR